MHVKTVGGGWGGGGTYLIAHTLLQVLEYLLQNGADASLTAPASAPQVTYSPPLVLTLFSLATVRSKQGSGC